MSPMSVTVVCWLEILSNSSCGCWPSDIRTSIHRGMCWSKTTQYCMFSEIIFLTVTVAVGKSPLLKKTAVLFPDRIDPPEQVS